MVDEYLNDFGRREQHQRTDINRMGESTRAVHGGVKRDKAHHSLTEPIVQTATFTFRSTQDVIDYMEATLHGEGTEREEYGRYGNPTVQCSRAQAGGAGWRRRRGSVLVRHGGRDDHAVGDSAGRRAHRHDRRLLPAYAPVRH